MLQNIRDNSQGWIAKTIIGVIVMLMALTGFDAIVRSTGHAGEAAEVNGEKITLDSLNGAVEMQRRQLIQQFGKDFDASLLDDKLLRKSALDNLIQQNLLLQGAKDSGMAFADTAVDQLILSMPLFQVDGKFNADRFDQMLRQQGFTRLQFRERLKQDVLISQLQAALAGSSFVTDAELQAFVQLEKQTRDFATLTLKADNEAVQIKDEELKAYYDEHPDQFMSQEQVVLDYIELKKSAFFDQVSVNDEDLQASYKQEVAALAEQRRAAHILLEVSDKLTDEQAKAKLEEAKQRIDKGEDFAKLAKELSQDAGSAATGGDLGFAAPGVYDPDFEKALYALNKGEVSAPVRSQFGWHLIKLLDVQAPEVPTFASLKGKLEHDLKARQVEQRFVEATKALEDAAYEASDLAQPAQDQGLQVQTSAAFGREGGSEGVTANRQVVQAAFSSDVLEDGANSGAIELDPDTVVVLRVKEHKKPELMPLEQVVAGIRETLTKQKANEALKVKGDALLADLRDGKAAASQDWKVVEAATRSQEGVEPVVLQALFRMPKPTDKAPTFAGVSLNSGDFVLVRLDGVSEAKAEMSAEEKANARRYLASRIGQQDFSAFRKLLEAQADIERY
ncbi:SurA N-terminal domain-containing protein [Aquipseudomonas ullengensis]|uniref:Periplasmic chaperone PpiD n=1 Tax=Aquipseudomonas ullengensis TaxID=2759166 RepID=A0A7W4LPZ6_9GAMM|nr:SurA N-terminal domain-containing protein [Pseudomonas ullengensis]MBB2497186.1 SurA N-terminal domain-containing protein [Pseudomonas ullengensis]